MSFSKKTIRDLNLAGKIVLMRADYNVSIKNDQVIDDYRIQESIDSIKAIENAGASKLIIISHLGRPEGKPDVSLSLAPVATRLSKILDKKVEFVNDCIGDIVKTAIQKAPESAVILLENLRFHPEEEKNDLGFAKAIVEATGAEVFVQEAFGVSHRAHASTEAITKLLPSVAGLLLEKEITIIEQVMKDPKRPFMAVVGGAKIPDKIDVIAKFIEIADCVAIGGALANDFLRAKRIKIGASLVDDGSLGLAKDLLEAAERAEKTRGFNFLLPNDVVVSESPDGKQPIRIVDLTAHSFASLVSYPKKPTERSYSIGANEKILDIGPMSASLFAGAIRMSKTAVWSGTMGITETKGPVAGDEPFAQGTKTIVQAMIGISNSHANKPFTVVGGGDTVEYVESQNLIKDFNHVSTGGSASLELMAGHKLPAYEALQDK